MGCDIGSLGALRFLHIKRITINQDVFGIFYTIGCLFCPLQVHCFVFNIVLSLKYRLLYLFDLDIAWFYTTISHLLKPDQPWQTCGQLVASKARHLSCNFKSLKSGLYKPIVHYYSIKCWNLQAPYINPSTDALYESYIIVSWIDKYFPRATINIMRLCKVISACDPSNILVY